MWWASPGWGSPRVPGELVPGSALSGEGPSGVSEWAKHPGLFGSSCRELGRISALPAPQRAHLQSGDRTVPASRGLDPRGAAQVSAAGSVPATLTPMVARSGQGHQQRPGPRRAFERCRRPWAHIPTTTHTGRRPFQCRSGAKVTWNRREGLVGGGWGQDRVPDD